MKNVLRLTFAPLLLLAFAVFLGLRLPDPQLPQTDKQHGVVHNWRYIHSDAFGHLDNELYYYDISHVMDFVRQANVLMLGTSRSLFAYDSDTLDAHTAQTGVRFYNLSFPFRESMRFPLQLIQKYGIRDKLVLIEADDAFFTDGVGRYASAVISRGLPSSVARMQYNTSKYHLIQVFNAAVKSVSGYSLDGFWNFNKRVLYRSDATGAWFTGYYPVKTAGFRVDADVTEKNRARLLSPVVVSGARELVAILRAQGCRVYFVAVPYPQAVPVELVRELAEVVGAGYLDVETVTLASRDGEHLTLDSARRFTAGMLRTLPVGSVR